MSSWRRLAAASALVTYLLIVFGGIVRVTGSGMGCGDDWPLCNGQLFPPWDFATWIEWGHRLVAGLLGMLILALAVWAGRCRRDATWAPLWARSVQLGVVYLIQAMLGAVTVWLELPAWSVILHLGFAMTLLWLLVTAWLSPLRIAFSGTGGLGKVLLALAAATVMLGGLVANLGAGAACQGFPLCNGSAFPGGHWLIHVHWTHRVVAYALVAGCGWLPFHGDGARRGAAAASAALAAAQLVVGAVMVLQVLPQEWRIAHVALGTALFAALAINALPRSEEQPPPAGA